MKRNITVLSDEEIELLLQAIDQMPDSFSQRPAARLLYAKLLKLRRQPAEPS